MRRAQGGGSHGVCCRFRERRNHVESLRRLAAVGCSSISFLQERNSALALGWQGNARVSPHRAQSLLQDSFDHILRCERGYHELARPITSWGRLRVRPLRGEGREKSHDPGGEPCKVFLGYMIRGSRQARDPFEVVPAGDSTAATQVRQRRGVRKGPKEVDELR